MGDDHEAAAVAGRPDRRLRPVPVEAADENHAACGDGGRDVGTHSRHRREHTAATGRGEELLDDVVDARRGAAEDEDAPAQIRRGRTMGRIDELACHSGAARTRLERLDAGNGAAGQVVAAEHVHPAAGRDSDSPVDRRRQRRRPGGLRQTARCREGDSCSYQGASGHSGECRRRRRTGSAVSLARVGAVLVTGMSGTGKSSALAELERRGFEVVDTDRGGWTFWWDAEDGHLWDEERIAELLDRKRTRTLYVSGTVSNQGRFYPRFDAVVLLSAPAEVLLARIANRQTNDYGKRCEERELILRHLAEVEPLLRATCTHELDASQPLELVVAQLVAIGENATS